MFQIFVIAVERRRGKARGLAIVQRLRGAVRVVVKGAGISLHQGPAPTVRGGLVLLVALDAVLGARSLALPVAVLLGLGLPLVLHAPVLEPDFDLPLGQVQQGRDFHPPGPAEVLVEVELLLQLQQLGVGVRSPQPTGAPSSPGALHNLRRAWGEENKQPRQREDYNAGGGSCITPVLGESIPIPSPTASRHCSKMAAGAAGAAGAAQPSRQTPQTENDYGTKIIIRGFDTEKKHSVQRGREANTGPGWCGELMNAPSALLGGGTPSLFITVTHQNSATAKGINPPTSPKLYPNFSFSLPLPPLSLSLSLFFPNKTQSGQKQPR